MLLACALSQPRSSVGPHKHTATTPDTTATKQYDKLLFHSTYRSVAVPYSDQTYLHAHNLEWPAWTRQGVCPNNLMQLFKQNGRIICQIVHTKRLQNIPTSICVKLIWGCPLSPNTQFYLSGFEYFARSFFSVVHWNRLTAPNTNCIHMITFYTELPIWCRFKCDSNAAERM